jgi:hypothetical protein
MVDTRHITVTAAAIGQCIAPPTRTMMGRATTGVAPGLAPLLRKRKNPDIVIESYAPLGLPRRGIEFAKAEADRPPKVNSALDTASLCQSAR